MTGGTTNLILCLLGLIQPELYTFNAPGTISMSQEQVELTNYSRRTQVAAQFSNHCIRAAAMVNDYFIFLGMSDFEGILCTRGQSLLIMGSRLIKSVFEQIDRFLIHWIPAVTSIQNSIFYVTGKLFQEAKSLFTNTLVQLNVTRRNR